MAHGVFVERVALQTEPCQSQAELKAIGLPAGDDFDTNHNGLHHWGWVEIISSREEERD